MAVTYGNQATFSDVKSTQCDSLISVLAEGRVAILGPAGKVVILPAKVQELLRQSLEWLAAGLQVTITGNEEVVTSQRAADLLGMSRPTFIKLLESGGMGTHRVGSHRRIYLKDVLEFGKRRQE